MEYKFIIFMFLNMTTTVFLLDVSTISTTSAPNDLQNVLNVFHAEKQNLENYVQNIELNFNSRIVTLELNLNRTEVELSLTKKELRNEKATAVQLEKDLDRLTIQLYDYSVENGALKAEIEALKVNSSSVMHDCEIKTSLIESELKSLKQNQTVLEQGIEFKISNFESEVSSLRNIWHYSRYGLNPITLMLPVN